MNTTLKETMIVVWTCVTAALLVLGGLTYSLEQRRLAALRAECKALKGTLVTTTNFAICYDKRRVLFSEPKR